MKDSEGIYLFIFAVIAAALLFYGMRLGLQKVFKDTPSIESQESDKKRDEQSRRMDEIREREERLMEDQKQRIKDLQR